MNQQEITQTLRNYKSELLQKYAIAEIALFGSYAKGLENSESDIDLLYQLLPQKQLGLQELHDLESFLKKILNNNRVDLVNQAFMNPLVKMDALQSVIYV